MSSLYIEQTLEYLYDTWYKCRTGWNNVAYKNDNSGFLALFCFLNWFCVLSVIQIPFGIFWWYLVEMKTRKRWRVTFKNDCLTFGVISLCYIWQWSASVAQLDAPSDWRPGGRGFNPRRGRQHSFVEIDHEKFSTVILSLPLIQEGQLSVSGERMCTILVNRLED